MLAIRNGLRPLPTAEAGDTIWSGRRAGVRASLLGALLLTGAAPPAGNLKTIPPAGNLRPAPPAGNLKSPQPQPLVPPAPTPDANLPTREADANAPPPVATPPTAAGERVTFAAAVQRALSRNPSVTVALNEIHRFEGVMKEVRAASLPVLNGVVTYTNLDAARVAGNIVAAGQNQINTGLVLSVPIVMPQKWLLWGQARDNVEVARLDAAEARRQVAIATARAYLMLVTQHRIIDVQERAVKNARDHLSYSHSRYAGGIGTRLDEVRAAQEVSSDQAQLQQTYTQLARAREALGVLIAADHAVDVADEAPMAAAPALPDALQGVSGRTDVVAGTRRARAADRVYHDRYADYLPYLTGSLQGYYQNPPTLTLPTWGYQALLVLTVPFYDGGYRYGAAEERRAQSNEAHAKLEALLRQANSDVRAAFETLYRADDAVRQTRDAARYAEDALKLATLAYRSGATTNIEVIDAERAARDAETAATIAEDAARQARLDLLIAGGKFP